MSREKEERLHRKAADVRKAELEQMENEPPQESARRAFQRKPYQVGKLIREQGQQIEHKSLLEYLAEKYDI